MKHACKTFLFSFFIFLYLLMVSFPAAAVDFGFLINQYAGIGSPKTDNENIDFEYRAGFVPRLSFLFADTGSFYASGGYTLSYNDSFTHVPELLRTELAIRNNTWALRAGRIGYSDPLSFIADGLFDGAHFTFSSPAGHRFRYIN